MAYSYQTAVSDGTLVELPITIDYIEKDDLYVLYDLGDPSPLNPTWGWKPGENTIQFSSAVPAGVTVRVMRSTDLDRVRHIFGVLQGGGGSAQFTNRTMDENFEQLLMLAQELLEQRRSGGSDTPENAPGAFFFDDFKEPPLNGGVPEGGLTLSARDEYAPPDFARRVQYCLPANSSVYILSPGPFGHSWIGAGADKIVTLVNHVRDGTVPEGAVPGRGPGGLLIGD